LGALQAGRGMIISSSDLSEVSRSRSHRFRAARLPVRERQEVIDARQVRLRRRGPACDSVASLRYALRGRRS
jgi:hypothetical protein